MTASADRRRRSTAVGAITGLVAIVAVVGIGVVALTTLRSSEEGSAPEVEARSIVSFPQTPNAVIGVVDDLDRLTSIAVVTIDPAGAGGSIVALPVNADQTNGFGSIRLPISRQPYTPGDEAQEAQLLAEVEPMLTLTIERAAVVGPDELAALLDPIGVIDVNLPDRVIDSDTAGSGLVVRSGDQRLSVDEVVEAFTAIDADGSSYSHHDVDAALWNAVAAAAGGADAPVPVDEFDRPVAPTGFDELWARLISGPVSARDLAIDVDAGQAADNETDADFVLVDRRDALMVFGSISPGFVSTPNESLTFSLVVGFTDAQVDELGEDASADAITKASMTRRFIGELLFAKANIVAVDLSVTPALIPDVTRIEIVDAELEEEVRQVSERFFADADIVVAGTVTDGVDAVAVLGADFLEQRAALLDSEGRVGDDGAETADDDPDDSDDPDDQDDPDGADFDVSDEFFDAEAIDPDSEASETADDGEQDPADTVTEDE